MRHIAQRALCVSPHPIPRAIGLTFHSEPSNSCFGPLLFGAWKGHLVFTFSFPARSNMDPLSIIFIQFLILIRTNTKTIKTIRLGFSVYEGINYKNHGKSNSVEW